MLGRRERFALRMVDKRRSQTPFHKSCWACRKKIYPDAKLCCYCGKWQTRLKFIPPFLSTVGLLSLLIIMPFNAWKALGVWDDAFGFLDVHVIDFGSEKFDFYLDTKSSEELLITGVEFRMVEGDQLRADPKKSLEYPNDWREVESLGPRAIILAANREPERIEFRTLDVFILGNDLDYESEIWDKSYCQFAFR